MQIQEFYKIYSVGSGGSGILLQNTTDDQQEFQEVKTVDFRSIRKFKFNGLFGIFLSKQDDIYFWGFLHQNPVLIPKSLQIQEKVQSISCGWQHSLILTKNNIYGLGSNKFFEIGLPEKTIYMEPQKLNAEVGEIKYVACGFRNSYLIAKNYIMACGQNKNNETGAGASEPKQQYTKVLLHNIIKLKCGQKFCAALDELGKLFVWGSNQFGQLGVKEVSQYEVKLLQTDVGRFDCGWNHLIVLLRCGKTLVRGRGDFGQQGDGKKQHNFEWVEIPLKGINVKCGSESSFIQTEDALYVSGWNEHGNLGIGTKENIYTFQRSEKAEKVKSKGAATFKFIKQ